MSERATGVGEEKASAPARAERSAAEGCAAGKVDIIGLARETALKDAQAFSGAIKLIAPAKVNLHLAVGERRADGYHDVVNIMHALMLHDVLHMRLVPGEAPVALGSGAEGAPASGITDGGGQAAGEACGAGGASCTSGAFGAGADALLPLAKVTCWGSPGVEAPEILSEQNLVTRAVAQLAFELLQDDGATWQERVRPVEVRVEKFIPHQAGLGGGSSDAAAALLGAAQLWGVPAGHPTIEQAARKLGSDVAFFLHGGCARFGGAGEAFEQALAPRRENVVLVKPGEGLSTAAVYRAFDENPQLASAQLAQRAAAAQCAADMPLFNNLAQPAERLMPELAELREWMQQQPGVQQVLLCGSGSTTFAVCESFSAANALATAAKLKGHWARATTFSPAKAAALPRR